MTNLTHAHMHEIGISTVLESSVVKIESSLMYQLTGNIPDQHFDMKSLLFSVKHFTKMLRRICGFNSHSPCETL